MAKRGREADYVVNAAGQTIHGLSAQAVKTAKGKPTGQFRYYATASKPRRWLGTFDGRQSAEAIFRFRQWQTQGEGRTVDFLVPVAAPGGHTGYYMNMDDPTPVMKRIHEIPEALYIERLKSDLLNRREWLAHKTGMPSIANLESVPTPTICTLDAVGDLYEKMKRGEVNDMGLDNAMSWWKEFKTCMIGRGITTLNAITLPDWEAYAEKTKSDEKAAGNTSSHRRSRFGTVSTIINFAAKRQRIDSNTHSRLKNDWQTALERPPQKEGKKYLMTPDHVKKLLKVATVRESCMILLSLNCALYPRDIQTITWQDVDLKEGTLVFLRRKMDEGDMEGTPRVGVLWKVTINMLKKLKKTSTSDFIFADDSGVVPDRDWPNDRLQALKKKAGFTAPYRAEDLRNTASTVASRSSHPTQWKVMMGQTLPGQERGYILKNPWYVQDACKAIGDYLKVS